MAFYKKFFSELKNRQFPLGHRTENSANFVAALNDRKQKIISYPTVGVSGYNNAPLSKGETPYTVSYKGGFLKYFRGENIGESIDR